MGPFFMKENSNDKILIFVIMEMKVQIPFQQLLTLVRNLTPTQKAKLRKELDAELTVANEKNEYIEMLLNGPIFNEEDIQIIEENRNSISAWRTKS